MSNLENKEKILSVKDLVVSFSTDRGIVHAVRGVSFDLYKGETLCIVGESGSGKSVTNKAIMGISAANAIIENGSILYRGEDLVRVSEEEFHRIRGKEIGMIFQDPLSALNPVMKVGKQIVEATMINRNILKKHYNDLISKELTALRNVEANANFEINKCKNEIESNKELVDSYKKLHAKKETLTKQLSSLKEEDKRFNNLKEKLNQVEKEIEKNESKIAAYVSSINTYIDSECVRENEILSTIDEKIDSREGLKKDITIDRKARYLKLSLFFKDLKGKYNEEFVKDVVNFFNVRNEDLKALIKIFKENTKSSLPNLKKDYSRSKAEAKKDTAEYAAKLKAEHLENMNKLHVELAEVNAKIISFESSLPSEEKLKVDNIKKDNAVIAKKKRKAETTMKENSVSKVSKDNQLEFIPFEQKELNDLYAQKDEVLKRIEEEKRSYINKTKITKAEAKRMALEVMKEVGIPLPERRFKQYPFEFSGGMRQRIVIAIALTANPDILICDEPTTALDVTIQAQILELINKLKKERNLSCIFITHDLGVVANMADRVAVMYAGKIVEYGTAEEIFFEPKHPYTWALLSSIPDVDSKEKLEAIPGTPPDMIYPPVGDAFALRSKYAMAIDFKYEPPYFKVSDTHYAATWLLYPDAPKVEMPAIVKTRIQNSLAAQKEQLEKGGN